MPTKRFLIRPLVVATVLAALVFAAGLPLTTSPAQANHIAATTYTGTHSGGGTVEFTVSADGAGVTGFTATNVPGETCTFVKISISFPLSISNHAFSQTTTTSLSLSGSFPTTGSAEGKLRARLMGIPGISPGCDSGTLNWTATT